MEEKKNVLIAKILISTLLGLIVAGCIGLGLWMILEPIDILFLQILKCIVGVFLFITAFDVLIILYLIIIK